MKHNSAPYAPLTLRRRALHLRPFRMVRLNLVGWSAVLAAMVAVGSVAGAITDQNWIGVVVAGLVLIAAVVTDRVRWRNSWMNIGMDFEEAARSLVQVLDAQGIEAQVESVNWDDDEEVQHSVKVRQRDRQATTAVLLDLRSPPDCC